MLDKSLNEMPLEELQKLLSISEKNLALSKLYRQGAEVIVHNKNRLEQIQRLSFIRKVSLFLRNKLFFVMTVQKEPTDTSVGFLMSVDHPTYS